MSLISPVFLWAVAACALPLWLHLSRRRQYKEMPIGTLRFLMEVLRERRKKSRFEEIPLLMLRLLAVALLAFLFMRPFFHDTRRGEEDPLETIVLLDASGSVTEAMAREAGALADEAAGRVKDGTKLTIAQFSDDVEVLKAAGNYKPRAGAPTDTTRALGWALDRLQAGGAGRVVLISHLAPGDLPPSPPRVWPPGVSLEVHTLTPPDSANAAVRGVTLLTPFVTEQMEVEALVSLPPGAERTVKLEAEGMTQTAQVPRGADRVLFKFNPPREEVRGWISVAGGDAWPADDRRPFAVRWVQSRRILLVDGHPGSTPFEGQAYFVQKALTASGAAHGKTPFQPEIVFGLSGRQGMADLSGVAAIALCGMPELTTAEGRALEQFVENGGGLLSVLDARWTRGASQSLESARLLPDAIRRPESTETSMPVTTGATEEAAAAPQRRIAEWDKAHPVLAPFDGREGGDLRDLEWRDGFELPLGEGWKALAKLDGGHALLLEKSSTQEKSGRVMVLAHSLTREWSDLPREPIFVPLVKGLFSHLSRAEAAQAETPPLHPGAKETRAPGWYPAANGGVIIVAASPSESAVGSSTESALRTAFGVPDADHRTAPPARNDPALAASMVPWRAELWPWLAVALLVLLAIENIVATRRKPATP
jgi:Aerotolerance regulator N-terminal